jgi:hypothetical protein
VGLERSPLSLVSTLEELLGRKSSVSGLENRDYGLRGSTALTTRHSLSANVDTNLADKWRSLGRYSSLEDSGRGVRLFVCLCVSITSSVMESTSFQTIFFVHMCGVSNVFKRGRYFELLGTITEVILLRKNARLLFKAVRQFDYQNLMVWCWVYWRTKYEFPTPSYGYHHSSLRLSLFLPSPWNWVSQAPSLDDRKKSCLLPTMKPHH